MEADMKTQFGPDGEFSAKDGEILDQCRKIMGSKLRPPGLRRQWMVVFPVALALTVQIFDWSPIWGPIAVWLGLAVPFLFYETHLRVRLWQVSDLALRLAEKVPPVRMGGQAAQPDITSAATVERENETGA